MARALMATGFAPEPAYVLARRLEREVAARNGEGITLEHVGAGRRGAVRPGGARRGRSACAATAGCRSSTCRSSCSSAARPAPASRRSRPRPPTGSASRASRRRTSSARRCGRSSRATSCRRCTTRASRRASAPDDTTEGMLPGFLDQTRNVLVGVRASLERALHEGWSMVIEGVHLVPGMLPPIDGPRRRPVRRRDRGRGGAPRAFPDPRRRVRGRATAREVRLALRGHPRAPGLHRRARAAERGAGRREPQRRAGGRRR